MSQPTTLETVQVPYGSPLYTGCLTLRAQVLRAPQGQALSCQDLATEPACYHFAALHQNAVVGAAALEPRFCATFYLKQLAMAPSFQRVGAGKRLVLEMEAFAQRQGGQLLALHSRVSAQGFYQKMGYLLEGGPFYEFGIPHVGMYKWLL